MASNYHQQRLRVFEESDASILSAQVSLWLHQNPTVTIQERTCTHTATSGTTWLAVFIWYTEA